MCMLLSVYVQLCSKINTPLIKFKDSSWSSRFFTGGICDTVKTVLDNKFNNNDYQSENNKIAEIRDKQCKSELAQ